MIETGGETGSGKPVLEVRHDDNGGDFLIWNKKEHNIIISRIISSHMGLVYIKIP